jgi:hypothetical protein
VRWTRIEEVVIMGWLIRRNEPGSRNYFQRELSSQSCPGRRRYDSFDRLEESNGGHKYRLARPCGCRDYFLVPISHDATPTDRDAYCFFLNVGN